MSYGWVDPDSIRMEGRNVMGDFHKADDGRNLLLELDVNEAPRLIQLLDAQEKHGVVFLDTSAEELNIVRSIRGRVEPTNRHEGIAVLQDGERVMATFPHGTFDDTGAYEFKGTGIVRDGAMDVFVARTVPATDPSPHP